MKVSARSWPGAAEVHVHQAGLDLDEDALGDLHRCLSTAERDTADRFHHDRERTRYIAARGWLRYLLGGYIGRDPRAVVFARGEHGKPRLAGRTGEVLRFNASHSEDTAIYAVARGREVGVDVERVRDDVSIEAVARRVFSATEQHALARAPADRRVVAFFECWTRREAYLKAIGIGLSGLHPAEADAAQWSMHSVDAGPGFAAALAIAARPMSGSLDEARHPGRDGATTDAVTLAALWAQPLVIPTPLR